VPEILLFLVNPIVFICLVVGTILIISFNPFSLFSLIALLTIICSALLTRRFFFEAILDNLVLFYALIAFIFGKRYVAWGKTVFNLESRKLSNS
jgi:hypothetical protein